MYPRVVNFPRRTDPIFTLINLYPGYLESIHIEENQIKCRCLI